MPSDPTILAFDTSAAHCAAALLRDGEIVTSCAEPMTRGQAERLMPLLHEVLALGGCTWADLDAIGVGIGPGNFTGIRISVSAARGLALGTTPVTTAAVVIRAALGDPPDLTTSGWLLAQKHPLGGFLAHPEAPAADLLSTATSLHALTVSGIDLSEIREDCLDFIDRLWSSRGCFRGMELDDSLDCEYCWYGLLALGHLAT